MGNDTPLRGTSACCPGVRGDPSPYLLLPVGQEAGDQLTDRGEHCELWELAVKEFWSKSVESVEQWAEVHKQEAPGSREQLKIRVKIQLFSAGLQAGGRQTMQASSLPDL